jgi:zeaxanthin glucosyltransferase
MANIGVFCLPMPSHLNLFLALGRALENRGHRLVFFGISDNEPQIRSAGFDFCDEGPRGEAAGAFTK